MCCFSMGALPPPSSAAAPGDDASVPFHPLEAPALLEPVGREVAFVHREDAMLAARVGEPDQRRVGEIDVAAGVARDDRGDFRIGLDRRLDDGDTAAPDPVEQLRFLRAGQEEAGFHDHRRNRGQRVAVCAQVRACRRGEPVSGMKQRDEKSRVREYPRHFALPSRRSRSSRLLWRAMSSVGLTRSWRAKMSAPSSHGEGFPAPVSNRRSSACFTASLLETLCETQYSASFCSTRGGRRTEMGMGSCMTNRVVLYYSVPPGAEARTRSRRAAGLLPNYRISANLRR